jgi:hypothetical protein
LNGQYNFENNQIKTAKLRMEYSTRAQNTTNSKGSQKTSLHNNYLLALVTSLLGDAIWLSLVEEDIILTNQRSPTI